jgi:hypothetical protein
MAAVRRRAWVGLKYVTTLFFLGVIVQFFLVGYGLFAMKHGATIEHAAAGVDHWGFGMFHPVNALILLGLSGRLAHYAWTNGKEEAAAPAAAAPSG